MSQQNPLGFLIQRAGWSYRRFEREFNFSHEGMMQAMAGAGENLPPRILQSLRELLEREGLDMRDELAPVYGTRSLGEAYHHWRSAQQQALGDRIRSIEPAKLEWDALRTPAMAFVLQSAPSMTAFAKQLKVPLQQVRLWVRGESVKLPKGVEKALRDLGYPYVKELIEEQALWAESWG